MMGTFKHGGDSEMMVFISNTLLNGMHTDVMLNKHAEQNMTNYLLYNLYLLVAIRL